MPGMSTPATRPPRTVKYRTDRHVSERDFTVRVLVNQPGLRITRYATRAGTDAARRLLLAAGEHPDAYPRVHLMRYDRVTSGVPSIEVVLSAGGFGSLTWFGPDALDQVFADADAAAGVTAPVAAIPVEGPTTPAGDGAVRVPVPAPTYRQLATMMS